MFRVEMNVATGTGYGWLGIGFGLNTCSKEPLPQPAAAYRRIILLTRSQVATLNASHSVESYLSVTARHSEYRIAIPADSFVRNLSSQA